VAEVAADGRKYSYESQASTSKVRKYHKRSSLVGGRSSK